MALVFAVVVCVAAISSVNGATPLEFGMEMSVRSYDSVCWYENLKKFPETNTKAYNKCDGQAKYQMDAIQTQDFFQKYPDKKQEYFGKWVDDMAMSGLPANYKTKCSSYLKDANAEPTTNESDALNDGGNKYPFRGFAYCLMKTLRDSYGDKAIEGVDPFKKHWMQALLDRENEFRARHGAEPLQLMKDLNTGAQSWSDVNAKECRMYHTKGEARKWNGQQTGESLAAGFNDDENKDISAYQAVDAWYEEIKDYPYPKGYQGGNPALFQKIGHFTQTVWKDSKYVGYGLSINPDCKGKGTYTRYITARYYPAGNMEGEFPKNVLPIKK